MYKHILIPTDGSELSDKAIDAGVEFARVVKARVTGFTAVPEYQIPSEVELMARRGISLEEHERRSKRHAEETLRKIAERARAAGVEFDSDYAQSGSAGCNETPGKPPALRSSKRPPLPLLELSRTSSLPSP